MKRFLSSLALATASLLPAASPALAADPVTVMTAVHNETVSPGGFQIGSCKIDNLTGEPILVLVNADVTYPDGQVQRFHINQPPQVIEPDGALIFEIFFAVPEDAATGTATFTCAVRVVGPNAAGFTASSSSTFQVT